MVLSPSLVESLSFWIIGSLTELICDVNVILKKKQRPGFAVGFRFFKYFEMLQSLHYVNP